PLAGISSYTQMLLQQIAEADPKRKLLEKIHTQTVRATGIVNNLLNFSRTGDTQFREVEINRVLDDTLQLLEPQLRNGRLEIVRHYGEDLPAAYGSASKLQQVFMNLAGASSSRVAPTKARTSPSNFPRLSRARCKPRAINSAIIASVVNSNHRGAAYDATVHT